MPEELLERARRAARTHGVGTVARALKFDRRRLNGADTSAETPAGGLGGRGPISTPTYSRVEFAGLSRSARAFAELELPSGIKLRLYSDSPQTMGLLSKVCGAGGGR